MKASGSCDVAIVGGGAGGTLVALRLLRDARTPLRIALIDPGEPGRGVAYATPFAEHLLNVPAARMSAFDDVPDDFVAWLSPTGEAAGERYAQRRQYAAYLHERLQEARNHGPASLRVIADRAIGCDPTAEHLQLVLASGRKLQARCVVLALGNTGKPAPGAGVDALPSGTVLDAWDYRAIKAIDRDADVTIAGSGLSMVDVALSLADNGHRGTLHALSRHALLPLPHLPAYAAAAYDAERLVPLPLRARMRALRVEAAALAQAGVPWQDLMNALRPSVRTLWRTLDAADQRRFLRHVARHWDVHRHRIAPQAHAALSRLRADGRLRLHRGRIASVRADADALRVDAIARDGVRSHWRCAHLVNATGVELRAKRLQQPLLDALLSAGVVRPGAHGIGIDTDADGVPRGRHGHADPRLFAIGSLRIGGELESIAVPDLRQDAARIAGRILESPAADRTRPTGSAPRVA